MKLPNFPEFVKKGNSQCKIYGYRYDGYDEYKVAYYARRRRKVEIIADYAEAADILGKVSLVEAARLYRQRHPATMPNLTVTQAVDEFILAKETAGWSARHTEDFPHLALGLKGVTPI